ncbi:DUF523 domain-containing protein [Candidatus Deferrimicrobium sp.]|uniref:DUF523 domain-containing protein n=1 Tax=Candidatus Deferrimicrobium sp. TaxID=3060586 RepID=UPI0027164263|nr:DUF523 domain-containing protein [Candidatus Deferrimicrobium sp.]MDO8738445.1 DUF523 domain-containing protein [Candidatus Deferrimicrobium sp.]MDP2658225.1 DUF523 domain-containing protein [Candidatus Deferrimicrobium sp.]
MPERVKILVSACLLGEKVRYDGGHKRNPFLIETLGPFVEWVRVCPEVDCGLPVPREAMRLVGDPKRPRLVTNRTGIDPTERMEGWAKARLEALSGLNLRGYICKKDSPSCGMEPVGVFTRMFIERFPHLPVEEEGRLTDPVLRKRFIQRVKA